MATLTSAVTDIARRLYVTDPAETLTRGTRLRIGEEILTFMGYVRRKPTPQSFSREPVFTEWNVRRGQEGTEAVAHDAGTTVQAAVDAFLSGTFGSPPSPFDTGTGGSAGAAAVFVFANAAAADDELGSDGDLAFLIDTTEWVQKESGTWATS